MRAVAATLTALLGLYILMAAIVGIIHRPGDWQMIMAAALMSLVGITTIRVAGYMLQQPKDEAAGEEHPGSNS